MLFLRILISLVNHLGCMLDIAPHPPPSFLPAKSSLVSGCIKTNLYLLNTRGQLKTVVLPHEEEHSVTKI